MDALTSHLNAMRIDSEKPIEYKRPRIRERRTKSFDEPVVLNSYLKSLFNATKVNKSFVPSDAPIADWQSYVNCLTRNDKDKESYSRTVEMLNKKVIYHTKRDTMKNVFAEWRQIAIDNRKPPPALPTELFDVEVKVKVKTPDGTTKIVIKAPYRELYDKFFSKGLNAPIKKRVQAFALMGFPMSFLEDMLKHHDKMEKRKPMIDELIDRVFNKLKKKN